LTVEDLTDFFSGNFVIRLSENLCNNAITEQLRTRKPLVGSVHRTPQTLLGWEGPPQRGVEVETEERKMEKVREEKMAWEGRGREGMVRVGKRMGVYVP